MENILLTWALKYAKENWSLIPLKPKSKEPLIPWQEFQKRRASEGEIRGWFQKWPAMNLGLVTGSISQIVVVDLDGTAGEIFGRREKLASSMIAKTGNGKQVYYKWIEPVDNSVSKIAPGVDIRGDGGYVVLPPSVHPNGKIYRWEKFVPRQITVLPSQYTTAQNTLNGKPSEIKPEGWIAKALEEMKIGNIDNTLTSILGRLRRDGYSSNDACILLKPHAIRAGATDGHLEEKISNIWNRYESARLSMVDEQQSGGLAIHSPSDNDSIKQFLEYKSSIEIVGIETGFPTLDKFLRGGIKSERLFTIAATTGTGKTNFSIALSQHLCRQDQKVLYFSTEFKYEKLWAWYSEGLGLDEFRKQPFHVCDAYNPNIEQIEKAVIDYKPNVVIFDYIQHLGKEKEILTKFMHDFQFLQRKYKFQGIVVAQLNRTADAYEEGERVEPRMSMIEGSATIEQASSRVLLLSKIKESPECNEIEGILAKNDNGETGRIVFGLYKNPYHFRELT